MLSLLRECKAVCGKVQERPEEMPAVVSRQQADRQDRRIQEAEKRGERMTAEEAKKAIEVIKVAIAEVEWNYPLDYSIAFEDAISALEKQIPKKVKKEILTSNAFTQWRKYNCPNCGYFLYSGSSAPFSSQSYCHQCGQKLDFGE